MTVLGRPNFFGSTLQATASGAIADGDPVILNADGTVSAVSADAVVVTPAGETMFFIGYQNDNVYRYGLTTAYDLSTASYTGDSFSVNSQDSLPTGLAFSPDGLKMFVCGTTTDAVYEYALTSAYDITTASFTQSFSALSQDNRIQDVAFNDDGTKMFLIGDDNNSIFEYGLSTGFDLSTASYSGTSFSVASQETGPWGLQFNTDGTKMFVLGLATDAVYEYHLSTGFDLSTASYSGTSFSISAQDLTPTALGFSSDGTKMYVGGQSSDAFFEYDLSTGFDLSTASYSGTSLSVTAIDTAPSGIVFARAILGTNLTADAYIGIANGAYADGTTATIQLVGSIDDAQSGLTAGETHYVQTDGTLSTTPDTPEVEAGYAISPTEIVVKGAYSTVTATVPEYTPTPLADAVPQMFQAPYTRLDLYYNGSVNASTATNFWTAIDRQGAYIANASPTAYTEIVSVTGSGMLGTIVTGSLSASGEVFIEVTIDGEVREWRILISSGGWRGILTFWPHGGWDKDGAMLSSGPANFSSTHTTAYSSRDTTTGTTDDVYLSPTSVSGGIRFKSNMKVRIKSATAFYTGSFLENHGVLYVID